MKEKRFFCKNCGNVFVVKVLEDGEAEYRKVRPVPVTCPKCKSSDIVEK